tara:strand:- start:170 stop:442 length:273 start_codon:yes stop_codon:yes gene_type:complete
MRWALVRGREKRHGPQTSSSKFPYQGSGNRAHETAQKIRGRLKLAIGGLKTKSLLMGLKRSIGSNLIGNLLWFDAKAPWSDVERLTNSVS